jgi:hypothetical protein
VRVFAATDGSGYVLRVSASGDATLGAKHAHGALEGGTLLQVISKALVATALHYRTQVVTPNGQIYMRSTMFNFNILSVRRLSGTSRICTNFNFNNTYRERALASLSTPKLCALSFEI